MKPLAALMAAMLAGCIGPPDHLIISGTHDEFNDSWKETMALSFPIQWGERNAPLLDVWNTTR